jgi:putative endonuclease
VYILLCADDTYYVGMSNDLERRLREHMEVRNPSAYTATRLPVILKWHQDFNYVNTAIAWEKRIKRWSVRKKEALIAGDFDELIKASKKNFS